MSQVVDSKPSAGTQTLETLRELALDLRWAYNHSADHVWERLDPELWDSTHSPWIMLRTLSKEKLQSVASDQEFQLLVADLHRGRDSAYQAAGWFQKTYPNSGLNTVAYFSMEFMLSEGLPIYSGGLGNVAGDQLKAASNLSVPVVGVGLLYQQGYFRQEIDGNGNQVALYPFNDPGQLPIRPLREKNGEWLRIHLDFPGAKLWLRTWEVQVGRARLYLLDTNDPANIPSYRGITSELYGGDAELRLKQEIVLGIGGARLLGTIGRAGEVCHLNEGHAAFAVLERARAYMQANSQPFALALTITRVGSLFTTHTPVSAGFDRFAPELMEKYFASYAARELGISMHELLALGRYDASDTSEPFNMAYLATRGSGAVNGVSQLHGEVSRKLFQVLFPRWPEGEVPVGHVTNGVHVATWDSVEADRLWERTCGKERWQGELDCLGDDLRQASDADLWELRNTGRKALVEAARKLHARQVAVRGATDEERAEAWRILDPNALTLGFARRFAAYKRPNLLLRDTQRLTRILTNSERPVQIVVAGKAHPQDREGQRMIREWFDFVHQPEVRARAVFLSDYDVLMAATLVQGVDVWLNTPRRPWEASGTSGMKVLVNGGLNLSELDGWWAEAYSPEVGWALGDRREHDHDNSWDAAEADALYGLLEREVAPEFYRRNERGIPQAWVGRMRESMARLTPAFSANRVVREYTEKYYLPAAAAFAERAGNGGALGRDLLRWNDELAQHWSGLRFGSTAMKQEDGHYFFQVQVFLGNLGPNSVSVELYADAQEGGQPQAMARGDRLAGDENGFVYTARIPTTRPARDYTPRVIPSHPQARVPLEAGFILWHDSPSWR
jgi:glycogen phosphorylase